MATWAGSWGQELVLGSREAGSLGKWWPMQPSGSLIMSPDDESGKHQQMFTSKESKASPGLLFPRSP